MTQNETQNFYDILELKPDASPQEIREAYLRTKSAYSRDSVALYTLVSPEERDEMLRWIEEAYSVLSNSEKRKAYDQYHGVIDPNEELPHPLSSRQKIVSIDRVPPMDVSTKNNEDLLVPPATDFPSAFNEQGIETSSPKLREEPPVFAKPQPAAAAPPRGPSPQLAQEIGSETEWQGAFLRKIREAQKMTVEEVSSATKISKTYLLAMEEEVFKKLPAAVYVRGFITQLCRLLKLPVDKALPAYMARYYKARPEQKG